MPDKLRKSYEQRVKQLQATISERDTWLSVLGEVAERIHGQEEQGKILDSALEIVLERLGLRSGWVLLGDDKDRTLHLAAWRGIAPRYLKQVEENGLEDCLCPEVFWTGHRMLARNTTQCPRMPDIIEGLREPVAHACVPLRFEGERRGVLNIAALPGRRFSDAELQFLETVGHQVCLAVERAKHLRAERARLQEARALAAINRVIGASLELGPVLQAVGDTARELIGVDRALILLGSDPRRVRLGHVSGAPLEELRAGQELDLVARDAKIVLRALTEHGSYAIEDWQADERVNKDLAEVWQVGAGIVACLRVKENVQGVLMLTRTAPQRWRAEAVELAEALAGQAAVAIENAQLYEERRRAYQELKDAQARMILSEKLAAVGTFAAGLAHEVRNPLNSVALGLALLERRTAPLEQPLAAEIKGLIGDIREEVRRLDGLVSDFLELSKAGRLQLRPTELDTVLDDVARLLRAEARGSGITLRRQALGDAIPPLALDAEKIKQVVINLMRNAMEAMPGGGVVTLESGAQDGAAVVSVRDTGPGLPEGLDIFQLFVTTKPRGTGIGLSIAQQIVMEHGGELLAANEPGGGARLTLRLPLVSDPERPRKEAQK